MNTIYDTSLADQDVFTRDQLLEAGKDIGATDLILVYTGERDLDTDIFEEHEVLFIMPGDDIDDIVDGLDADLNVDTLPIA